MNKLQKKLQSNEGLEVFHMNRASTWQCTYKKKRNSCTVVYRYQSMSFDLVNVGVQMMHMNPYIINISMHVAGDMQQRSFFI